MTLLRHHAGSERQHFLFLPQGALTQLIQYYHGFHKVLNQPTFRSLAVRSELINLHHLMVEVKKHKPNF